MANGECTFALFACSKHLTSPAKHLTNQYSHIVHNEESHAGQRQESLSGCNNGGINDKHNLTAVNST